MPLFQRLLDLFRRGSRSRLLQEQSDEYWSSPGSDGGGFVAGSHWRGHGRFRDTDLWDRLGQVHLDMYKDACRHLGCSAEVETIVEWGCGGGMNAVKFAPLARRLIGVDVSKASLDECAAQLQIRGLHNFQPIEIRGASPEAVIDEVPGHCQLFLCTYVFELLPDVEYAERILGIASQLMAHGAVAFIQFRYREHRRILGRRPRKYARHFAQMTTFTVEEFWLAAERRGLAPCYVKLLPQQPELNESRYAYCVLRKD